MRRIFLASALLVLHGARAEAACGSGSATITGAQIAGQTHRQAILAFRVPHASAATVQVFSDSGCTKPIDDTNPALWPGSSAANRAASVVDGAPSTGSLDGQFVEFVAGTLTGNRALTQSTRYWAQITNTADGSQATVPFSTAAMPLGNTFPEQPPFDANRWDNRGYPIFALAPSGRNALSTDATTGLLVKRMTFAGDHYNVKFSVSDGSGQAPPFDTPVDINGTCTGASSLASAYATGNYPTAPASGYASCPNDLSVWLPLPTLALPAGNGAGAYAPTLALDYINLFVWGKTASGTTALTVCPTLGPAAPPYRGSSCKTVTLGTANTGAAVPCAGNCASASVPDPGFASWGFAQAPLRGDLVPSQMNVSVSGTAVTLESGDYFQITWPAGAILKIAGSHLWGGTPCANDFCTIAAVTSSKTLTISQSCATGCPAAGSPAAAVSRVFGFRITGSGAGGAVSLQVGYEYGVSPHWLIGEDSGQQHCNANPVAVATDANGAAYSGFTRQGYLCWIDYDALSHGAFYLLVPRDENGAPLGEARPLGWTVSGGNWSSNGAAASNPNFSFAGWDTAVANKGYATLSYNSGATALLVSFVYDSTRAGACNPPYKAWVGAAQYPVWIPYVNSPTDTCFTYTNLTEPTMSDVVSQITAAYAQANPGFSLAAFAYDATTYQAGFFYTCLGGSGTFGFANPGIKVCATFNAHGTLLQVYDSFSQFPARWGNVHGPIHTVGNWHSLTFDFTGPGNTGFALAGPWQMNVTRINRAGFGSTPNWTSSSALDSGGSDNYACPPGLPQSLVKLGASGNHCLQLEVDAQPHSVTPDARPVYPRATTEAQQFPCSFNANYSCLQPLAVGDHLMDLANGPFGEGFIIVTQPAPNGGAWDFWAIRGSGIWPNTFLRSPYPTVQAHGDQWVASMQALQLAACTPFFGDSTAAPHVWYEGYVGWCLSHGAAAQGLSAATQNVVFGDVNVQTYFDTLFDASIGTNVMPAWSPRAAVLPKFNASASSISNGNLIQFYADAGNLSASPYQRQWTLAERHLNPSFGSGAEVPSGMGAAGYTLAPLSGTAQTYSITDPYSNGPPDPKNLPFMAWAGRYLLKDYSGPGSSLPDSGYGMCYALQANECVPGSAANTMYVSATGALGCTQGLMNQHSINCPAVVNAGPAAAQMQQIFINGLDLDGGKQRMLGQALAGAGRQWQFNGPKLTPDGGWYLFPCVYPDGLRTDICLGQIPVSQPDSLNRTTFVKIPVGVGGRAGDAVRIEFFYQEWGGCTSRQEHCYTSANASVANPFLFGFESQAYTPCDNGCQVQIPALSGRVVYYAVHRKNGSIESSGPVQVAAQP